MPVPLCTRARAALCRALQVSVMMKYVSFIRITMSTREGKGSKCPSAVLTGTVTRQNILMRSLVAISSFRRDFLGLHEDIFRIGTIQ